MHLVPIIIVPDEPYRSPYPRIFIARVAEVIAIASLPFPVSGVSDFAPSCRHRLKAFPDPISTQCILVGIKKAECNNGHGHDISYGFKVTSY
jgi:hypothetical protein